MLERPNVEDAKIIACLREDFGLNVEQIEFLPLGADRNTAVYRADSYFVKLRSGDFNEMTLVVPKLLHDRGSDAFIAPIPTRSGALWAALDDFKVAVFPFIEGRDASETEMYDQHWIEFGKALKMLHTTEIPETLISRIPKENYAPKWRELVRNFVRLSQPSKFDDAVAAELATFLQHKKDEINRLVDKAEALAASLQSQPFVLCHADCHAWNTLIDTNGHLYVVDWDTLILAPKERDLMFIGGGLFLNKRPPQEEDRLFYQGYGETEINRVALAYYRYERIVQDISAYCEEILFTAGESEDRKNGVRQLIGQFNPGGVVERAFSDSDCDIS